MDTLLQLQADITNKLNRLNNEGDEDKNRKVDEILVGETHVDEDNNVNVDNNDNQDTDHRQDSTVAANNETIDVDNDSKRKSPEKGKGKSITVPKKRVSRRRK